MVTDVDKCVRDIICRNDVGASLITRVGYSIGIAFAPSWDEGYIMSLKQGDETVLRPGMTFHLIPWMWGWKAIKPAVFLTPSLSPTKAVSPSSTWLEK